MKKDSLRRLWGVISCMVVIMIIIIGDYNKAFGCVEDEKIALLKLQDAIKDEYITIQWSTGEDCCRWEGVTCDPISKRIISLSIYSSFMYSNASLNASLLQPFEELQNFTFSCNGRRVLKGLVRLPKLKVLDLTGCYFRPIPSIGELPSLKFFYLTTYGLDMDARIDFEELTNSSSLELLNLRTNEIESQIPPPILGLTSLKMLGLSYNNLNGSFPEGLCALTNLEELDLSYNAFKGVIPTCLTNLTSLRFLDLSNNQFSGSIPSNILSSLKSLEHVSLSGNDFDGFFSFSSFVNNSKFTGFELESNSLKLKVETENAQWLPSFFQLKILRLSNFILNGLPSFLLSQYDLRVVSLSNNGLTGELPLWFLTNNSKLQYISLSNNYFSGQFMLQPDAYHAYMDWLDLSMNQVTAEIPAFIGTIFPNLIYLNLSTNAIEGSIPYSIRNMTQLESLDLSNNHFSGKIPWDLFNGRETLRFLKLSNNSLGGNLTNFLSNMLQLPMLGSLFLDNNNFNGDLSLETVSPGNTRVIQSLDIGNNSITGRFPDWIAELPILGFLVLSNNHLQGKLPTNFCKLIGISVLDLSWNNFSDTLPSCNNTLLRLTSLHLQGNGFHGPLPTSLSQSPIATLDVRDNKFSGLIPSWIGSMQDLKFLLLKGNLFHGSIPLEICQIENLRLLDLSANNLSGSIPPCFSRMSFAKTKVLDFHIDEVNYIDVLSAPWYSYESQLQVRNPNAEYYRTSDAPEKVQFITKSLYESYTTNNLYLMVGIDVSLNKLTGPIPMHFQNWENVRSLNISYNNFNGSIPGTLSRIINLESLDLSHNMLTGKIPSEITELNFLTTFFVTYNNLSGPTPTTTRGQFVTFDARSYEGNPLLCGPPLNRSCGPTKMPQTKIFAEPEQNDSFDKTTFLWSFFGSFVVSCFGSFVFIYFSTNIPQRFLVFIGVEKRVSYRRTIELQRQWKKWSFISH